MVVKLIPPLRDRILLGALPFQDSRSYLLGPQGRPDPLDAPLFDQGGDRLFDIALFDRAAVGIGRCPLVEELRVLERNFMRQGEHREEARRGNRHRSFSGELRSPEVAQEESPGASPWLIPSR